MLTGKSINLAQNLLVKQFPEISGFMDTCLGKMHQFEIVPVDKPYIQLLKLPLSTGRAYQIWKQINMIMISILFISVYVNQK